MDSFSKILLEKDEQMGVVEVDPESYIWDSLSEYSKKLDGVCIPKKYLRDKHDGTYSFLGNMVGMSLDEYVDLYRAYIEPLLVLCSIQRGSRLGLSSAFKKFPEELARMLKSFLY